MQNAELTVKDTPASVNNQWAGLFKETRNRIPGLSLNWNISAKGNGDGFIIQLTPSVSNIYKPDTIFFFPDEKSIIDNTAEQKITKNRGKYLLKLKKSPYASGKPERLKGVMVWKNGKNTGIAEQAIRVDVPVIY